MKNQLTQIYVEKMKAQIMLKLVDGQSASLKEVFKEFLEENQVHSKYIISAYFHVKHEVLG